jgi:hypothetical protein
LNLKGFSVFILNELRWLRSALGWAGNGSAFIADSYLPF